MVSHYLIRRAARLEILGGANGPAVVDQFQRAHLLVLLKHGKLRELMSQLSRR